MIKNFIDYLAPSGYMRYSADGIPTLPEFNEIVADVFLRSLCLFVVCLRFSTQGTSTVIYSDIDIDVCSSFFAPNFHIS